MIYTPSLLEQVQLDMGARLQAHPYFANVPIFVMRPRVAGVATMIQEQINTILSGGGIAAQNGKLGAAILVDLPTGDVPNLETVGPDIRLGFAVRVFENPLINMGAQGTGISAEDLMLSVLNLNHRWFIQRMGSTMICDKTPFRALKEFLAKKILAYDCQFILRMQLQGPVKTPIPIITGDSVNGVTITGIPGAQVWYTLDGTYPWSGNAAAILLDMPLGTENEEIIEAENNQVIVVDSPLIQAATGTLVQAVAYKANQQASDLAAQTIE